MVRAVKHAQHGVLAWRVTTSLHTGTHMNAPIHLIQRGDDLAAVSPDRLFGNGAVLDVPKGSWEVITAADLEAASPASRTATSSSSSRAGITSTPTASSTSAKLRGSPKDAAEWLVTKNPKLVAVDTPSGRPCRSRPPWARIAAARR